jgi:hypothetical protein
MEIDPTLSRLKAPLGHALKQFLKTIDVVRSSSGDASGIT